MSEYETYWLTDFPVRSVPRSNYGDLSKKQTKKYTEKLVILQSIGIIVIKSKEIRIFLSATTESM